MPNIFHQSVEDILKAATPEQRILWNYVFLRWGERISISQFHFYGTLGAGELGVYSANKMYFAVQLSIPGYPSPVTTANAPQVYLYNEANAIKFVADNLSTYWDTTAAGGRVVSNSIQMNNILFSRLLLGGNITMVEFIGYRIGI